MKFSYKWLQEYFEKDLSNIKELAEVLTFRAFEIDGVEPNHTDGQGGDLIDIDVLPNRSHDCFCYQGIAKEISVLTGLKLKQQDKNFKVEEKLKSSDYISLSVDDTNLVPCATKRLVQNVKVGQSPKWLKEKLESIGQKSINNVVDITNYVMWETGQPVHCFDFDKIAGVGVKKFIIRKAKEGEKITTLDGGKFELDENIVVIADKEKALDIAGIKGGEVSGIDENTQNIVLSICNFNQTSIRKTSKKLGLRTDASVRFENGISPDKVKEAVERLSQLISQIAGGKVAEDILEVYPRKANQYKVGVSIQEVNRLLGLNLSSDEIEDILKRLDFKVCLPAGRPTSPAGRFEKVNPIDKVLELALTLEGKSYRHGASVSFDAPDEFDCSSFTAYLFAQAGLAIPRISIDQYFFSEKITEKDLQPGDLIFSNTGEGNIFYESIEFLKGSKEERGIDHVGLYLGDGKIVFASRYNENKGVMTVDLEGNKLFKDIIGYGRISDNSERYVVTVPHERLDLRIKEDLIEEIGRIYGYRNIESATVEKIFEPKINKTFYYTNKIRNILVEAGFSEVQTYTFGEKGNVEVQKPLASNLGFLRTNLSNGLRKSLELNIKNAPVLGLDEIKIFEIGKVFPNIDGEYTSFCITESISTKSLNKGESKDIKGYINNLFKNNFNKDLDYIKYITSNEDEILEINLDKLIEELPTPKSYEDVLKLDSDEIVIFKKISQYPFILRDIAVFVQNEFDEKDVLKVIKENAGDLLIQTKLFDTYSPKGENKTSYAFNLVFQSQEKTLTDDEINKIMKKITEKINSNGWKVR